MEHEEEEKQKLCDDLRTMVRPISALDLPTPVMADQALTVHDASEL